MLRKKCAVPQFPFCIDKIRDVQIDYGCSMMHKNSLLGYEGILGSYDGKTNTIRFRFKFQDCAGVQMVPITYRFWYYNTAHLINGNLHGLMVTYYPITVKPLKDVEIPCDARLS